ncbi:MAG TPA: type II 3-dehydroquinate dehydratase [Steroidobacteraceae bacterium]|nr:type II 3-dehydroquinate dehydratase [Steroidobacteraceae bacterium]
MARILLLNGPNLNLLGSREPGIYGSTSLQELERTLTSRARQKGFDLDCAQSNAEHELIARIHGAKRDGTAFMIFNPGAFTHTSVALRDAIQGTGLAFIEVHLSNIFAREEFRHRSYFSDIAAGCIFGLGPIGYELALDAAAARLAAAPTR